MNRAPDLRCRRGGELRWTWVALIATCLACLAAAYGIAGAESGSGSGRAGRARRHRALPPVPVQVAVAAGAHMTVVPRSYLGLSTEYWALPLWSPSMPLLERVMSLVSVRGDGPMILRVGGDSADHSFWMPQAEAMPPWAFSLDPSWLAQAGDLVRRRGVKLILDLNLITDTPASARQWARAAEDGLPHGSIVAFEVGNEPDIYSRTAWLTITAGRSLAGTSSRDHRLPAAITARGYAGDFRTYARALAQVAPHVKLAGPALANPVIHARWVSRLVAGAGPSLGLITIHRYPYSGCTIRRGSRAYATIPRVLGADASTGLATALRPVLDAAHDADLPVRLTELNSVNCGGRPGVSDAFATALWAPDALFALLRAGLDGVNLHVRADTINAPFALGPAGLQARPLLYGLIMFARALGRDARLVRLSARHASSANVAAWAVRVGGDILHVVLIDKGPRSVRVALHLPATATAAIERLLAPSARSRSGVTLGGRWLAADGRWQGTTATQTVVPRHGVYTVEVRRQSAAMLSVRVAPGALAAPATRGRPPRATRPARPSAPVTGARRSRAAGRAPRAARSPRR